MRRASGKYSRDVTANFVDVRLPYSVSLKNLALILIEKIAFDEDVIPTSIYPIFMLN